jgi:hypothetical protein
MRGFTRLVLALATWFAVPSCNLNPTPDLPKPLSPGAESPDMSGGMNMATGAGGSSAGTQTSGPPTTGGTSPGSGAASATGGTGGASTNGSSDPSGEGGAGEAGADAGGAAGQSTSEELPNAG